MADDGDRGLSLREAARRLGLSERTVRTRIKGSEIRAVKIGGVWRIRESEIERLLGPRGGADD